MIKALLSKVTKFVKQIEVSLILFKPAAYRITAWLDHKLVFANFFFCPLS